MSPFIFSLPHWLPPLWCVFSVLSFIGWGSLLANFFQIKADYGLKGVWGAAFSLMVVSCLLCAVHVPLFGFVYFWMGFGGVLFFTLSARSSERRESALFRTGHFYSASLFLLLIAMGLQIFVAAGEIRLSPFDDAIAYIPFVRNLLESGSFIDPFSLRRGASYGGQTVLLALAYPGLGMEHTNLLESGILFLLLILLLLGWNPSNHQASRFWSWLLIPIALTEYPTINLASQLSPVLFLLGMVRSINLFKNSETKGASWGEAMVLALTTSAFVSLRAPFLVLAGLLLFLEPILESGSLKKGFFQGSKTWTLCLAFLIPWAVLLYQAVGSIYYPLFSGNIIPVDGSMRTASEPLGSLARFGLGFWLSNLIILVLFPICSWKFLRTRIAGTVATYIACFITAILLTATLPKFPRAELDRYHHAYLLVCSIVFLRSALDSEPIVGALSRAARFATVGSALIFIFSGTLWISDVAWRLKSAVAGWQDSTQMDGIRIAEKKYSELQSHLPKDAVILSATDQPYLFDYGRNKIEHLDIPGHAAPGGAMPQFSSGDQLDRYFIENRVEYLVFSRPERSTGMYSLQKWQRHFAEKGIDYHTSWSKQFLGFFSYASEASKRNEVVYQDDLNVAIKLRKSE